MFIQAWMGFFLLAVRRKPLGKLGAGWRSVGRRGQITKALACLYSVEFPFEVVEGGTARC